MRTMIILSFICAFFATNAQTAKWDRPMKLVGCHIRIDANSFTATTFVEMEFYNPNEQEIEGLYAFKLLPGQAITAFQLDLHGKYRNGTIEEKWKATNAYNTIVGKRIDPALLTMEYNHQYKLRIYPLPAKGSRKITFTIQQLLKVENQQLLYTLPLFANDTVQKFTINIQSTNTTAPISKPGIIAKQTFYKKETGYELQFDQQEMLLSTPISFAIPMSQSPLFCQSTQEGKKHFALRLIPDVQQYNSIKPSRVTVLWDASAKQSSRNIEKEISFLQQYLSYQQVAELTILTFNYKLLDSMVFDLRKLAHHKWKQHLSNIEYAGPLQLGCIQLPSKSADICMLFSDGYNSYGKKQIRNDGIPLFGINTSNNADSMLIRQQVSSNGGSFIPLNKLNTSDAISQCSKTENWLLDVVSKSGKTIIEQSLPLKISESILLNGTMENNHDSLFMLYGNNVAAQEQIVFLNGNETCTTVALSRIEMLQNFDKIILDYNWETILEFGLIEKVVTPNTAFIVLERMEDYIKYNIQTPDEMKAECEKMNYVWKDSRALRKQQQQQQRISSLQTVVNQYNYLLDQYKQPFSKLRLQQETITAFQQRVTNTEINSTELVGSLSGMTASSSNSLEEVIVVGYGTVRKRSMTSASTTIYSPQLLSGNTVEQALQGRVPGLQITGSNGMPGAASSIQIRGASSLSGNTQPMYVLDGMPVSGNINEMVNLHDIDHITVLKDALSASRYGPGAGNGVILIQTKKVKRPYNGYNYNAKYRLKNSEDVAYLQEMKAADEKDKWQLYKTLELSNTNNTAFYFDMAQHFFEIGLKQEAVDILMNAAESGKGNPAVQHAMAYVFESWKMYDKVIEVLETLASEFPGSIKYKKDLGWAYYQNGNVQQAIQTLQEAVLNVWDADQPYAINEKANILFDLNVMIGTGSYKPDSSTFSADLLKPVTADLRIMVDANLNFVNAIKVKPIRKTGAANIVIQQDKNKWMNDWQYQYNLGYSLLYQPATPLETRYDVWIKCYQTGNDQVPAFVRIKTFKNMGKPNQTIEVEIISMNNQYGEIGIGSVDYKK